MTLKTASREFRIWDKQKKRWVNTHAILSPEEERDFTWSVHYNHIITSQFTGIYDVDGNKIFEFDIVRSILKRYQTRIFYVKYIIQQCRFNISEELVKSRAIQVIGNVFDNIEFLEPKYQEIVKEWRDRV